VRDAHRQPAPVVSVMSVVKRYLRNLRATLETNVDQARRLLALAVGKTVLVREGRLLVAEITGNLAGVLTLEHSMFGSVGAGRGISSLPNIGCILEVASHHLTNTWKGDTL